MSVSEPFPPSTHLWRAAAGKGQALLHLQAWQPVVHYHVPPCAVLVKLKRVQARVCVLITDQQVQQQPLLCADGCKCAQEPAAAAQASLQQGSSGCEGKARMAVAAASSC